MNRPVFQSVFGHSWDSLPPVMQKHYANRADTDDETIVEGTLDVMCRPPLKWLGQIPVRNENTVPVTVIFKSDTRSLHLVRTFHFAQGDAYVFRSRMIPIKDNEVIELMRFGLGWKTLYRWDGGKVVLEHDGYVLRLFGHYIPIPLTLLIGQAYAEETAINDHSFEMMTCIRHPWWGKVYEYKGRFRIQKPLC